MTKSIDRPGVLATFELTKRWRPQGNVAETARTHGISIETAKRIIDGVPLKRRGRHPGSPKVSGINSRFKSKHVADRVARLPAIDSPFLITKNTRCPHSVVRAEDLPGWALKDGFNAQKIGRTVMKGAWSGMRVWTLTLEERATCPTSCKHWRSCLVPETRVLTADLRWVPLGSLVVGQRIAAFDEGPGVTARRKTRVAEVEKLGRETLPCFKIKTTKGDVIATADHRWVGKQSRVGYQWISTDLLRPGDKIQFFCKPWEQDLSYEAGRIRGFLEGEGCVSTWGNNGYPKTGVSWAQRPGKLFDEINTEVAAKGFRVGGIWTRVSANAAGITASSAARAT